MIWNSFKQDYLSISEREKNEVLENTKQTALKLVSFEDYTDDDEQSDLESYKKFINTLTYDEYINKRRVNYYGD